MSARVAEEIRRGTSVAAWRGRLAQAAAPGELCGSPHRKQTPTRPSHGRLLPYINLARRSWQMNTANAPLGNAFGRRKCGINATFNLD